MIQRYIVLDIEKLPEGVYLVTSKDVQGLIAQGNTFEEAVETAKDLAIILLEEQKKTENLAHTTRISYPLLVSV